MGFPVSAIWGSCVLSEVFSLCNMQFWKRFSLGVIEAKELYHGEVVLPKEKGWSRKGNFVGKKLSDTWKSAPLCICWCISKERNKRIFQ